MYFENAGKENSKNTVDIALETANKKGIKHIVIASTKGDTARQLKDCGLDVTVVTHAYGNKEPGVQEMTKEVMEELKGYGFKIFSGTHVLSGAERGISRKFGGVSPVEMMAQTLKMFGQGVKVGVEISTMALDAGLIPTGEDIIAIGGSQSGADTAIIIRPAHANAIFDTKIREIICKPV
ncbi:hypothetical protein BD780_001558 [Clostridium tetanomorphum]|uniref:Pyruvate kinase C-terminal domain-containing protein n=1 Tax=Clostridium tetanomorphum TaxID=1553 RepID=A0A923EAI9_CLOTT|nr:pyruvate kinase alpha/beta domain-containing protein [Clostridium tetanomorphum]KAJ52632.1 hypothetical protein CTM_06591 [Clostridium tetanomorphum DSM 665]MBC2396813.1 hypothetical protein [Clostridium tetanomorphum]MBP1863225.1 hypothetical protein [Clostridium tetanomorphum]NRS84333.1 hypothetical protein [Clostridium tetanomorphum]NRZ97547.1 hypothetical protein [Clostridium tetanomorphum]